MEELVFETEAKAHKRSKARRRWRGLKVTKKVEQKLMGAAMILICAIVTLADEDATSSVLFVPLGLWMLFTKEIVIY